MKYSDHLKIFRGSCLMLDSAIPEILGCDISKIEIYKGGGNSRIYRVEDANGHIYAVKSYPPLSLDNRDRLGTEFVALTFLSKDSRIKVPIPITFDRSRLLGIYEWIEGNRQMPTKSAIDAMLHFIDCTYDNKIRDSASNIPLASESCLSGLEILTQLRNRLNRLKKQADEIELQYFLVDTIEPLISNINFDNVVLPEHLRCLNPGDFGVHNMLFTRNGPVFIDMEYFGWDDPVKQVCDVLLHPAMSLDEELSIQFLLGAVSIYAVKDHDFVERLRRYYLAFGLRWALIMLNEFLPERWAIRAHAGGDNYEKVKLHQLEKARALIESMNSRQKIINAKLR